MRYNPRNVRIFLVGQGSTDKKLLDIDFLIPPGVISLRLNACMYLCITVVYCNIVVALNIFHLCICLMPHCHINMIHLLFEYGS